jgi:hypothetical protein
VQRSGDLPDRKSFPKQFCRSLERWGSLVMSGPACVIATVTPKRFELSFERNGAVTVNTIPEFLEMHFEASALLG